MLRNSIGAIDRPFSGFSFGTAYASSQAAEIHRPILKSMLRMAYVSSPPDVIHRPFSGYSIRTAYVSSQAAEIHRPILGFSTRTAYLRSALRGFQ